VALGFLAGFHLVQRCAAERGVHKDDAADLVFWAMVGGILGGRALYVALNWGEFSPPGRSVGANLLEMVKIHHGGLVFYGGFFGAVISVLAVTRRKSLAFAEVADLLAPALPLGHAFGRIGCFFNGCCFGHPWAAFPGVRYPAWSKLASGELVGGAVLYVQCEKGLLPPGAGECLPVFPIQIAAAAMNLAIFAALLALGRRQERRGQLFPLYLVFYGAGRFALEFGRGDHLSTFGPFTPAQVICLPLLCVGGLWLAAARSPSRPAANEDDAK